MASDIPMPIAVDPADIERYKKDYRRVLHLKGINYYRWPAQIEDDIRRRPGCSGQMTFYWPPFPPKIPGQQNAGSCHILCSTKAAMINLLNSLHNAKLSPESSIKASVSTPRRPMRRFVRTTFIQGNHADADVNAQPEPTAPATAQSPHQDESGTTVGPHEVAQYMRECVDWLELYALGGLSSPPSQSPLSSHTSESETTAVEDPPSSQSPPRSQSAPP
ncbi:hypothetical protein F5Y10DRAFT_273188 [Nemania abortiva]|nr:hypothetical protein F5Y10DRAFT_273188 [Nemania abortiva]